MENPPSYRSSGFRVLSLDPEWTRDSAQFRARSLFLSLLAINFVLGLASLILLMCLLFGSDEWLVELINDPKLTASMIRSGGIMMTCCMLIEVSITVLALVHSHLCLTAFILGLRVLHCMVLFYLVTVTGEISNSIAFLLSTVYTVMLAYFYRAMEKAHKLQLSTLRENA